MERIVRIDGIKTNLGRLSDEELAGYLVHTGERIDADTRDMDMLQGELFRRLNIPLPGLGETALNNVIVVQFGQAEHDPFIDDLGGLPPNDVA